MHRHRVGPPRSHQHAEGFLPATIPLGRSRHRSHRRYVDWGGLAGRGIENDEVEREDERELVDRPDERYVRPDVTYRSNTPG